MKFKIITNDSELQEAFRIRKEVFVDEQHVPLEEEIDALEDVSTHFLLYTQDETIGTGRFRSTNDYGKLERICILKNKRKMGAGKALMAGIEDFAKKEGVRKLRLSAQTHAIPFYENLGYHTTSEEYMDAGIPHKTMEKAIEI